MKVLVLFLLLAFVLGGRSVGRRRPDRTLLLLGGCLLVCVALYSYRFA